VRIPTYGSYYWMEGIMPDMPRYSSDRRRSRHSQRPAYDTYQQDDQRYDRDRQDDQRYDRPAHGRRSGPYNHSRDDDRDPRYERRRGDLRVQSQSRRRSQHDEDKTRLRHARYPEEDGDELEWRRARYQEEDQDYEQALHARSRNAVEEYRDSRPHRGREYDEDDYDDDEPPVQYSRRRDRWQSRYWSRPHFSPRFPDQMSRYMEKAQSVFTRSMRATQRAENRLLARFAQLQPWQRVAVVAVLIVAVLGPSLLLAVNGYQQYTQIKARGADGIQRLLAIKTLVSTTGKGLGIEAKAKAILQPGVLSEIKQDSDAALVDFEQVNAIVNQHLSAIGVAGVVPILNTRVAAVGHLARVGIDIGQLGDDFASQGAALAPMFNTSLFASSGPAILTPATFQVLAQLLGEIAVGTNDMASQLVNVQPGDLPVNAKQRTELEQVMTAMPGITQTINGLVQSLPMLRWATGVDSPRLFLIQTMDRAELRPGGGFTGQFGKLVLKGGRLGTISLTDVTVLDNNYTGYHAPAQYQSWWPFGSWALRESNMSGDFPTSAQLAMKAFTAESGINVDGDISIAVEAIEHLLAPNIVGPITIPCYKVTVTDQNLEDEIHYFQLGGGVALDQKCFNASASNTTLRKSFTATLALALQQQIRTLPADRLGNLFHSISADFAAKNIEVYFGNSTAEAELTKDGLAAAMIRDNHIDSTYIVQSNIGGNKGNIYVSTKVDESVTLDSAGDARHDLKVTMDYHPTGNIYSGGLDTMRDYVRVYVPSQSRYIGGGGFDETTSAPRCYAICQPQGAPSCLNTRSNPTGAFLPGAYAPSFPRTEGSGVENGNGFVHTDAIGGPTNLTSDEPSRAMFGGLIVIPPFCMATWTIQWTVPHIAAPASSQNVPYTFVEEHQSGTENEVVVTIKPASGVSARAIDAHVAAQLADLTCKLTSS
jgi:Protein of unknown function (DUF4012)